MKYIIAAIAAAVVALAGCGDDGEDWRTQLDCSYTFTDETGELFVENAYGCVHGGTTYRVYEFANAEAQENWKGVAEEFGAVVVAEGDDWIAALGDKAEVTGDRMD
jgi:hypothetical protein